MAKKSNKHIYIIALALILGGLGSLIFFGLSQSSIDFLTVAEAKTMEPGQLNAARLYGLVEAEGIERHQGEPGVSFIMRDRLEPDKTLAVEFKGAVPDTFKPDVEVIVEGNLNQESGVFEAKTLMTKCPSKYKEKQQEEYEKRQEEG